MKEHAIKQLIVEKLNVDYSDITNIKPTPSGLTNDSFFATIHNEEVVVRVPGVGTENLVNRVNEKKNLQFGTKLGLNPSLIYFDIDSGFKITKKISEATALQSSTIRNRNIMKKVIQLFQTLHHCDTPMHNDFELFSLMDHYESLVNDVNPFMLEKLSPIKHEIMRLKRIYNSLSIQYTPCHIDPVADNILKSDQNRLYLIDWEYSGNFDPLWDLATLFLSLDFSEEERLFFLMQYFERTPRAEEMQRMFMHTIFQDYLWSLWSVYKSEKGDEIGGDVDRRYRRALDTLSLYKEQFDQDIVG